MIFSHAQVISMDWFGCAPSNEKHPMGVSEISEIIRSLLDDERLLDVWVRGEITNYKRHPRGHLYFSLSEERNGRNHIIPCVMWRSYSDALVFEPSNGKTVMVFGSVEVYLPHGRYQLIVRDIRDEGLGDKYLLFEQWKKELQEAGLFDRSIKKPLPAFPARVGVVTAESGAALRDIMNIISRRFPVEVLLSPTLVQGDSAPAEIAEAIRRIDGKADVIIVGRGGGSFEDLFPFSHPDVVRAIAACRTPVISAVGHEVDTALSDYAADMRAATPSEAAELAVPDRAELFSRLEHFRNQMRQALEERFYHLDRELSEAGSRLGIHRLRHLLDEKVQDLIIREDRIVRLMQERMEREKLVISGFRAVINGHDPGNALSRGYCLLYRDGRIVGAAGDLSAGDRVDIRFADGTAKAHVDEVNHDNEV